MKNTLAATFSKDNLAAIVLLASFFLLFIAVVFNSSPIEAKANRAIAKAAAVTVATVATAVNIDTIIVTATRLK